ncbi:MAG: phosphoglycerate kinase [bacterium]
MIKQMKTIRDIYVKNKTVLVRVDLNVALRDGKISDDFRIQAILPTINYLFGQNAKIILLSHLGRPSENEKQHSLWVVAKHLSELIKQEIVFIENLDKAKDTIDEMDFGQIAFLENLRFYDGEVDNDADFAKKLADLGEVYINDAFGVCHRMHASVVGIPKYLPSAIGLLVEKEIKVLSNVMENSQHPLVAVIGGAKISTKIKMIDNFLDRVDDLILGGALANTVIAAKGIAIGRSVVEKGMIEEVKKLELTNTKLHIPVDVIVSADVSGSAPKRIAPVGRTEENEMILDIGPDTINLFEQIIKLANMIICNGPMGLFEVDEFSVGSKRIISAIAESDGFSVVGGGDSIALLNQLGLKNKINHISTGGGAMLKFLSGEKLPGLEVIE